MWVTLGHWFQLYRKIKSKHDTGCDENNTIKLEHNQNNSVSCFDIKGLQLYFDICFS